MYKYCIIYANCQGEYLKKILLKSTNFSKIEHIENYKLIQNHSYISSHICNADLFIYQPINSYHNKLSSDYIINNLLNKKCKIISFPYIYNNAIWIFDKEGISRQIFKKLFLKGVTLQEVLTKFEKLEIDFNFQQRFDNTMNILKIREQKTDIKVHQYILDNFTKKKLFISPPHPTIHMYYHCIRELYKLLNLDNDISFTLASTVLESERAIKLHFGLIEKIKKTPYDLNFYKFAWKKQPDDNWFDAYSNTIKDIYNEK